MRYDKNNSVCVSHIEVMEIREKHKGLTKSMKLYWTIIHFMNSSNICI